MKKHKITVFDGDGKLAGKGKITVDEGRQAGRRPRGQEHHPRDRRARSRSLPGLEPDGKLVWTYKEAMVPPAMPKSLLVVGSGAIGIEFASFYRTLGAEVTVVEVLDRVLPVEDEEISAFARKQFEKQGMKIMTGATVKALKKGANNVTATIEAGGKTQDITVERVILAVGIVGNVENIGLEGTRVKVEKTHVVVNEWLRDRRAGRLRDRRPRRRRRGWRTRRCTRASSASRRSPASRASIRSTRRNIPGCTYCRPQVASVGLTEKAAQGQGPRGERRQASRSSATARRSRSARPRASSRPCSTPRPASCSAPT